MLAGADYKCGHRDFERFYSIAMLSQRVAIYKTGLDISVREYLNIPNSAAVSGLGLIDVLTFAELVSTGEASSNRRSDRPTTR